MRDILIATNNSEAQGVISGCIATDFSVDRASTYSAALDLFKKKRYEYVFLDVELVRNLLKEMDHRMVLQTFWRIFPSTEIIVLCTPVLIREAVEAVKAGASNYLTYPVDPYEVRLVMESIDQNIRRQSELNYLRDEFWRGESLAILRTNAPAMKEVFSKVQAVAPTNSTVLLSGETGTGKGVIANLIHQHSRRRENQFISIHCSAIPENLLESELFGHEKGAFTGAVRRKLGRFEIAHGGTFFLDEIGTLSSSMQIKLLQVLQDRTFQRLGAEAILQADVRIIAATNVDLKKMCEQGDFRQDLFYRLNVFPIEMPPLRQRIGDIALLVEGILNELNRFGSKEIQDVDSEVLDALRSYSWPGNIRELENLIERAYILEKAPILTKASFPTELFEGGRDDDIAIIDTSRPLWDVRARHLERVERQYLTDSLAKHNGSINKTATAAGLGVRQLHKLLTKHQIKKEDFKPPTNPPRKSES